MRIKMKLVTKLFLFCFLALSLIVGLIGYGALEYVKKNAVKQYAESMQRSVEIARDGVDAKLSIIQSISIQVINDKQLIDTFTKIEQNKCGENWIKNIHLPICDQLVKIPEPILTSYTSTNRFVNQISIWSNAKNENDLLSFRGTQLWADFLPIEVAWASHSSEVRVWKMTESNVRVLWNIMFGKDKNLWAGAKKLPFLLGWDDSLIFRNSNNQIMNQGYTSPAIVYSQKILNKTAPYVMIMEINVHYFDSLFDVKETSTQDRHWNILDSTNHFVYHEDENLVGESNPGYFENKANITSGYYYSELNGIPSVVGYAKSKINNWYIFYSSSLENVHAVSISLVVLISSLLFLFIAIISMTISFYAQRIITRPLNQLSTAIASVEHGATKIQRVQLNSSDEIGALGRTMNFVADLLDQVKAQSEIAKQSRNQVQYLLDNSGHGIITFGSDLCIHSEFSSEMNFIYRKLDFIGRDFVGITFPNEYTFLHQIFDEVFESGDSGLQETYLSLLPAEANIAYQTYALQYKMISKYDQPACMVIFTDITEKRELESKLDQEARAMKMIVKAVQNRNDVLQTITSYRKFAIVEIMMWLSDDRTVLDAFDHLFRQVHTFKGSFAQFQFVHMGQFLHALEEQLSKLADAEFDRRDLERLLNSKQLLHALEPDEGILREALGDAFFDTKTTIAIDDTKLEDVKRRLFSVINNPSERKQANEILAELHQKPFRSLLETYPAFVAELATGLEKFIHPLEIVGGELLVEPLRYTGFTQSLVHVFRNILDHGIESIDERVEHDKDEYGRIECHIIQTDNTITLRISDDGRGIDQRRVIEKAIQKGLCTPTEAESMTPEQVIEFIFADDFSTKDEVSELSGRGVGMAAVKAEVEKIGGKMIVNSVFGTGTTFEFVIPN